MLLSRVKDGRTQKLTLSMVNQALKERGVELGSRKLEYHRTGSEWEHVPRWRQQDIQSLKSKHALGTFRPVAHKTTGAILYMIGSSIELMAVFYIFITNLNLLDLSVILAWIVIAKPSSQWFLPWNNILTSFRAPHDSTPRILTCDHMQDFASLQLLVKFTFRFKITFSKEMA